MGLPLRIVLLLLAVLLSACSNGESATPSPSSTKTWTDMAGRQVVLKQDIQRIALLRTMDIYLLAPLLGQELDRKVIAVGNRMSVTDIDGYKKLSEAYQLDQFVALGSVYSDDGINVETVMGLYPDMILVDVQFKERASVRKMIAMGLPVVFIDLNNDPFFGPPRAVHMLGQMLGVEKKADEMADLATVRTSALLSRIDRLRQKGKDRPVLYFEQGNTVPEKFGITDGDITSSWGLIWHRLGADNIGVGSNFQVVNPERILTRNPDLIVIGGSNWDPVSNIMRLGFQVTPDQAISHLTEYTRRTGWEGLKAVRNQNLYGLHYGYYGPPWGFICFEAMAKMLYPEEFIDMDPEKDMQRFFERYMRVSYSGVFSVKWRVRN